MDVLIKLLFQLKIEHPVRYLCFLIIGVFLIRSILCIFKACAIKRGEADKKVDEKQTKENQYKNFNFLNRWGVAFKGGIGENEPDIDDLWLPVFIGIFELTLYPILIYFNCFSAIGGWIAVKTASAWQKRTPHNRFIFGIILSLTISFFIVLYCFESYPEKLKNSIDKESCKNNQVKISGQLSKIENNNLTQEQLAEFHLTI